MEKVTDGEKKRSWLTSSTIFTLYSADGTDDSDMLNCLATFSWMLTILQHPYDPPSLLTALEDKLHQWGLVNFTGSKEL